MSGLWLHRRKYTIIKDRGGSVCPCLSIILHRAVLDYLGSGLSVLQMQFPRLFAYLGYCSIGVLFQPFYQLLRAMPHPECCVVCCRGIHPAECKKMCEFHEWVFVHAIAPICNYFILWIDFFLSSNSRSAHSFPGSLARSLRFLIM